MQTSKGLDLYLVVSERTKGTRQDFDLLKG